MATLKGLDLSHWNSGFDVAKSDVDFVICKATDGTSMVDDHCDSFVQAAKKSGKKYGVYAFAEAGGTKEADWFLKNVDGYVGEGILALDWEADALSHGVSAAKAFLDRVYDKTGVKPLIYTSGSVLSEYDWTPVAKAGYGLWLARWADSPGNISPWGTLAVWQYTDSHSEQGYRLDGDTFYGDRAAWDAYAGGKSSGGGDKPDTGGDTPDVTPDTGDVDVDGWWGTDTTRLAQQIYGTSVDGNVSGQNQSYKASNPGLVQGWQWHTGSAITGSQLILAIQHEFHVNDSDANGIWGPNTCKRLQDHYGITQDGVVSGPSELVKALQRTWNAGKRH